jgi:diaminopimelate epimerase
MEFTKIQGVGNDFIILNNMKLGLSTDKFPYIARKLCKRKTSIGADGLIIVDFPNGSSDFKMIFFNSDGSLGEMCGNGARCIARYAYINDIAPKKMTFETTAGVVSAEILENRQVKVKLNNPSIIRLNYNIEIDKIIYECSYVELGNPGIPHLVVKYPSLKETEEAEIFQLGKFLRYYKELPKGANVNFYDILDENTVIVKTYERGVEDFTLACGTGSASTALALQLKKCVKENYTKIVVPGGELFIEIEIKDETIQSLYLIGDTNIVAIGNVIDEDLIGKWKDVYI